MQFGWTLNRLPFQIRHYNLRFGPVRISKADIKDGFHHPFLNAKECLRLFIILPRCDDEPQFVGIPLACTMGWVQSPPTFCTMSETVCDLCNQAIPQSPRTSLPHGMEHLAAEQDDLSYDTTPLQLWPLSEQRLKSLGPLDTAPPSNRPFQKPLDSTDVFVDDFIQCPERLHC